MYLSQSGSYFISNYDVKSALNEHLHFSAYSFIFFISWSLHEPVACQLLKEVRQNLVYASLTHRKLPHPVVTD